MDFKDTLLLPNTPFEMRGNLVKKQDRFVNAWNEGKLYHQMREVHRDREEYVLHDGPPYANNPIHLGHALNKTLKDFVVRSRHKMGYKVHFVPGWDTHGLPIEQEITKSGVNRKELSLIEFRKLCEAYAKTQVERQMKDMKALGTVADYDHPYLTLQHDFEAQQVRLFGKMCEKGMIYKGLKPVYWSPSSETALAEAEIEYHDKKDPSIFVRFKVNKGKGVLNQGDYLVIWTTTPWTLPANLAISAHPEFEYSLVKVGQEHYLVLAEFVENLMKEFGFDDYQVERKILGKQLEYITAQHPFYERESVVILGDHVTNDSGTGLVHTAPGFGMDDYLVGLKYGLKPYCNVDAQGRMTQEAGEWLVGQTTEQANKTVIEKLQSTNDLLKLVMINHSYPHDWRTKKPIIFRATPQWFASIDVVRQQVLDEIKKVNWKPTWGEQRIHNMIADRSDWTISRQRAWGLPIPIIYTEDDTPIMESEVFEHIAQLFEQYGSNCWYELSAEELLPKGYTHPNSPNGEFRKETDILDVWFDSGSSHTAALEKYGVKVPHDLYLEGSDQYRGWFNSSLIISTAVYGVAPYKNLVSHGFIVDDKGEKFSKSKGNGMVPSQIIDTLGAEILRLWVASVDYTSDISISQDLLKQVTEMYRKIRNTLRFIHGNVTDLTFDKQVTLAQLPFVDRQVLAEVNQVLEVALKAYQEYDFSTVTSAVSKLLTNVMSAYYLDFTKDILYIHHQDDLRRRQVQTVLVVSLEAIKHILTPILPFTMQELHEIQFPNDGDVQLPDFIQHIDVQFSQQEQAEFEQLWSLREAVYKALEEARANKVIGNSLKAKVKLHLSDEMKSLVDKVFGDQFCQWIIVSQVEFVNETLPSVLGFEVSVVEAQGVDCPRCWNVVSELTEQGVCPRCAHHLSKK